jgi:flagellar basal body rod protein FlgG
MAEAAEAIVDLKMRQRQVEASAKVVETADAVLGFLLDVRA